MKGEMLEFVLEQSGVLPEIPHFHMVAPKGARIIDPAVPWYDRHIAEIRRRFPSSSYARHPELTRGNAFRYWAVSRAYASGNMFGTAVTFAPVAVGAAAVLIAGSELSKTKTGNLGMQEIPGSRGGYSNPMGGGDSDYYPFKGFFDWLF